MFLHVYYSKCKCGSNIIYAR